MCNLCHYLKTIDVDELPTINPWSSGYEPVSYHDQVICPHSSRQTGIPRHALPSWEVISTEMSESSFMSSKSSADISNANMNLTYPLSEVFLLNTVATSPTSYGDLTTVLDDYPSYRIRAEQSKPDTEMFYNHSESPTTFTGQMFHQIPQRQSSLHHLHRTRSSSTRKRANRVSTGSSDGSISITSSKEASRD